jgi:hypothetical protein
MVHLNDGRAAGAVLRWGRRAAELPTEGTSLSAACTTAFAVVVVVLGLLALVIQLVTLVLPARAPHTDPAVVAAIAAAVATQQPGAQLVHIREAP